MKILLISNFYPPHVFGGYEMYAQTMAVGLRKRGHEVYVLTSQGHGFTEPNIYAAFPLRINNFYRTNQASIFKKAFRFFFNPQNFVITKHIIAQVNPDIISIWNLRLLSIMPLVAASRSEKPLVLHLYDPWFVPIKVFKLFPWLVDNMVNIKHVITCSSSLARQYEAAGIRKTSITILPHGITIPTEKIADVSSHRRGLLIVASLSKEKGIDIALKALAILVNKRGKTNLFLNIYGNGSPSYQTKLGRIIKKEGLEFYVHFKGWVKPERLGEVFAQHHIFICPERWPTLPLVLLQAMANEMPVIGTDCRGIDEVILDGINGLLVPPDDAEHVAEAIERLDSDDFLARRLGQKARETVIKRFNVEEDIKKIENYYLHLIEKN